MPEEGIITLYRWLNPGPVEEKPPPLCTFLQQAIEGPFKTGKWNILQLFTVQIAKISYLRQQFSIVPGLAVL